MAKKENLHVGDQVQFLRMSNKAVSLAGKIAEIHEDSDCVDVLVDGTEGHLETAHAADVTVIKKATAAEQRANAAQEKKDDRAAAAEEKKAAARG
jgi:hypothetical protein